MTKPSSSKIRSRQCICAHEKQCRGMSLAFQMYQDARGGHVEVPQAAVTTPEFEFLHRMNELRKAYFRHLNLSTTTTNNNNVEYVALHHFHPKVIRKLAEAAAGGRLLQVPPTFRLEDTRRLGWEPTEADRVYNLNGQRTEEFYFVPNYPIDFAYRDLKQLAKAERCTNDISTDVYQNAKKAIQARKEQERKNRKAKQKRENRQDEAISPVPRRRDSRSESSSKCAPIVEASEEKPTEIATPDLVNKEADRDRVQTNAKTEEASKDTAVKTESTLNDSFCIVTAAAAVQGPSKHNSSSSAEEYLGASDAAVAHRGSRSASHHDELGCSDKTVTDGGASSPNLHSSANSLQITDPAWMQAWLQGSASNLQGSASNLHGSDLTIRASGAKLNCSDTTLQTSNIVDKNKNEPKPLPDLEDMPKRQQSFVPWLNETTPPRESRPSDDFVAMAAVMPARRHCAAPMPACETKAEFAKRVRSTAVPRIETILESPDSGSAAIRKAPVHVLSRFATEKKTDCSPSTPRRMVSKRELDARDAKDEEKARRKRSILDLGELEEGLTKDEPAALAARKGSEAKLSLIERRKKLFQTTNNGSSVPRTSSGHSAYHRKRMSAPTRSRSLNAAGVRRSSDTSLFAPEVASKMTTYKRIDSTFRALQQFSHGAEKEDNAPPMGPHDPRRTFSNKRRSRSDSPTDQMRRGRRLAIVASDGEELVRSRGPRNHRSPRRTKSDDRMPKRASDPSPSRRSASPSLRRTKSEAPSDRTSRRARIEQGKQNSQESLGQKSGLGLKRTLSPKIKRIDTSKRAMQQFILDANASSDLSFDLSPREKLKRTCSKMGAQRALSPKRELSPLPPSRSRPFRRNWTSDLNDLDNSAPAALEHSRDRAHGSLRDILAKSGKHTERLHSSLSDLDVLSSPIKTRIATGNSAASSVSNPTMPSGHSNRGLEISSDSSSRDKASVDMSLVQSAHDSSTANESVKGAAKTDAVEAELLSESNQAREVDRDGDQVSLSEILVAQDEPHSQPKSSDVPEAVDWEAMGFSSCSSLKAEQSEVKEEGPSTFSLPRKLVGKRVRQQLLAEVVVSANQRQSLVANKCKATDMVTLSAMNDMLATVKEESEEPEEPAPSLPRRSIFQGHASSHLDESSKSMTSLQRRSFFLHGQTSSHLDGSSMSLSLGGVFEDKSATYDFESSGCMSSEQLRTVFPFKALQNRRKSSGSFPSPHGSHNETSNDEAPMETHMQDSVHELLPNIAEEEGAQPSEVDSLEGIESFGGGEAKATDEETVKTCQTSDSQLPALEPMDQGSYAELFFEEDLQSHSKSMSTDVVSPEREDVCSFKLAVPIFAAAARKQDTNTTHSAEGVTGDEVEDPIREFNLSFPRTMAMASRTLPPAHACLGDHSSLKRGRSSQAVATNGLLDSDKLDKKIEISFRKLDWVPKDICFSSELKKANPEKKGSPEPIKRASSEFSELVPKDIYLSIN